MKDILFGIDLGGTKTEIIALNQDGTEIWRERRATPAGDYPAVITQIAQMVTDAEAKIGTSGSVGVGIPGSLAPWLHRVQNANSTWLNGQAIDQDLQELLQRPIRVENDANCFAVSEAVDGAAAGKKMVIGVIIGTGCGSGIAINGVPWRGHSSIAGEFGHTPLPYPKIYIDNQHIPGSEYFAHDAIPSPGLTHYPAWDYGGVELVANTIEATEYPGPHCYCGRRGCIETWLSGTGLQEDFRRATGQHRRAEDIIAAAEAGDAAASACLLRYYDRLARSLAMLINILDPDAIVLGGGLSKLSALYHHVPARWDRFIFSNKATTPLLPPKFGDSSGVRGAAWLWRNA